jgi:hypothetical protein
MDVTGSSDAQFRYRYRGVCWSAELLSASPGTGLFLTPFVRKTQYWNSSKFKKHSVIT